MPQNLTRAELFLEWQVVSGSAVSVRIIVFKNSKDSLFELILEFRFLEDFMEKLGNLGGRICKSYAANARFSSSPAVDVRGVIAGTPSKFQRYTPGGSPNRRSACI